MTQGSYIRQSFCARSHFRLLAAVANSDTQANASLAGGANIAKTALATGFTSN